MNHPLLATAAGDTALIITALGVFLTATAAAIAAWASLSNGRRLKTSNGKSIGEYAEGVAAETADQSATLAHLKDQLAGTHAIVVEHVAADKAAFEEIHAMVGTEIHAMVGTLADQDARAIDVAEILAEKVATDIAATTDVHDHLLAHDDWERHDRDASIAEIVADKVVEKLHQPEDV